MIVRVSGDVNLFFFFLKRQVLDGLKRSCFLFFVIANEVLILGNDFVFNPSNI